MSLRVHAAVATAVRGPAMAGPEGAAQPPAPAAQGGDGWATRLAKLIPAEALGLYGAACSLVPASSTDFPAASRTISLYILAAICLLFSAAIRLKATSDHGRPQIPAVAIAVISFMIWLAALGAPNSPLDFPVGYRFIGPLSALIWASVISYFYKGDVPTS